MTHIPALKKSFFKIKKKKLNILNSSDLLSESQFTYKCSEKMDIS